jgi:hypothetical protein
VFFIWGVGVSTPTFFYYLCLKHIHMTIQDLINVGFKIVMPNPKDVYNKNKHLNEIKSTLQPDYLFSRGNKTIIISYQGVLTEYPTDNSRYTSEQVDKIMLLADSEQTHFIQLKEGESIVYENYSGVFPTDSVLNEFIS